MHIVYQKVQFYQTLKVCFAVCKMTFKNTSTFLYSNSYYIYVYSTHSQPKMNSFFKPTIFYIMHLPPPLHWFFLLLQLLEVYLIFYLQQKMLLTKTNLSTSLLKCFLKICRTSFKNSIIFLRINSFPYMHVPLYLLCE